MNKQYQQQCWTLKQKQSNLESTLIAFVTRDAGAVKAPGTIELAGWPCGTIVNWRDADKLEIQYSPPSMFEQKLSCPEHVRDPFTDSSLFHEKEPPGHVSFKEVSLCMRINGQIASRKHSGHSYLFNSTRIIVLWKMCYLSGAIEMQAFHHHSSEHHQCILI